MNRADLTRAVRDRHPRQRLTADQAVVTVLDVIARSIADGEPVTVTGFGRIEVVDTAARSGRDAATGERIPIPPSRRPRFKASPKLLRAIEAGPDPYPPLLIGRSTCD